MLSFSVELEMRSMTFPQSSSVSMIRMRGMLDALPGWVCANADLSGDVWMICAMANDSPSGMFSCLTSLSCSLRRMSSSVIVLGTRSMMIESPYAALTLIVVMLVMALMLVLAVRSEAKLEVVMAVAPDVVEVMVPAMERASSSLAEVRMLRAVVGVDDVEVEAKVAMELNELARGRKKFDRRMEVRMDDDDAVS